MSQAHVPQRPGQALRWPRGLRRLLRQHQPLEVLGQEGHGLGGPRLQHLEQRLPHHGCDTSSQQKLRRAALRQPTAPRRCPPRLWQPADSSRHRGGGRSPLLVRCHLGTHFRPGRKLPCRHLARWQPIGGQEGNTRTPPLGEVVAAILSMGKEAALPTVTPRVPCLLRADAPPLATGRAPRMPPLTWAGEGPRDRYRPGPKDTCSGLERKQLFIGAPVSPARRAHAPPRGCLGPSVWTDKRPSCSRPSAGAGSPKHRTQPSIRCQPTGIQPRTRPWPRPCVASAHGPAGLCSSTGSCSLSHSFLLARGRARPATDRGTAGTRLRAAATSRLLPLLGQLLPRSESFPQASRHGSGHDEPQERSRCPHNNGRAGAEGICRHKELLLQPRGEQIPPAPAVAPTRGDESRAGQGSADPQHSPSTTITSRLTTRLRWPSRTHW